MRLLSVRVKNVRMHEDRTVEFDRERTVVAGPNESGKSTLVDAIERVLCYPHRSTADNLEGFKPRAGGGAPEVTLTFERHGRTYEIHKVFKGPQSLARLTDEDGLTLTGDEAEERLRGLLGFGETQLRSPFYGWSHLWARQGAAGQDPTDGAALGAAAKELDARLKRMTGTVPTESKKDTATCDRIMAEHNATFTPTGMLRNNSPLGAARAELAAAREAAAQAAVRLSELESAAAAIVREDALIQEGRATLADAERRLAGIQETLAQIEVHEQTLAARRAAAEAAARAHAALAEGDATIEELTTSINDRIQALAPREREIERLLDHERQLQAVVSACLTALDDAVESQRLVVTDKDLLDAVARVFVLETDRGTLEAAREQINAHATAIAAIDVRLAALPDVDRAAVEAIEDLDRQRQVSQAKLEASATRLELLRTSGPVVVAGRSLAVGETCILTDPAEVTIGDGTTIQVRPGGGESILELRAEVAQVRQDLAARLAGLGLKAVAEARTTLEQRLADEAARDRRRDKIADLDGDGVQRRLESVTAEIRKVEAEIDRKQPAAFARPADTAAVAAALQGLQERRRQADAAVQAARADFDTATKEVARARQTREDLELALATARRELLDLRVQTAGLESVHGTDRRQRIQSLAADKQTQEDAVAAGERALAALDPDRIRLDKQRYDGTVEAAKTSISDAHVRRARAEADLDRSGTTDPHGVKAAADARYEVALRRHAEVERRVEAVRRLRELFEKRRQEEAELVAAPLRAKVSEYLDALFGTGTRVAVTKCGDTFADLAVARPLVGGLTFEFEELSGGTKEQVAAACRLAMAEVLAGGDAGDGTEATACLPMVFDDAFVNSDPERIEAVQRVLYLGARRGLQIIVLSCNPKEYANFAARRVDLPRPTDTAAAVPAAPGAPPSG